VDANLAAFKPVAGETVLVGVVDKYAFVASLREIAFDV
jgi:hypothetical protein